MDFSYGEEHEAVRQLANQIFEERVTHERLKAIEALDDARGPFDAELWSELARAGLLGLGVPESAGGAGLDFLAPCLVIEAAGRTAAYVPAVETLILGADAIANFGTTDQIAALMPAIVSGELIVTAALSELVGEVVVDGHLAPVTTATIDGEGWVLQGTKACVPSGLWAGRILVPATITDGSGSRGTVGVFIVDPSAAGVSLERQDPTTKRAEAVVALDHVQVGAADLLGGTRADGSAIVAAMVERATAALCVEAAGVCAAALALTATYAKERVQFDKPIATFQAVGQRAADAYVDTEAVRLTAWQAAWRLAEGLPAAEEVATAKFWAAEGGQRVVHAAAHLHGGVGVDRDYPLHRFFLLIEHIEFTLGGANTSLARLGAILADTPV